jgi:hypothetical protein
MNDIIMARELLSKVMVKYIKIAINPNLPLHHVPSRFWITWSLGIQEVV